MKQTNLIFLISIALFAFACNNPSEKKAKKNVDATSIPIDGEMNAELTSPPLVPKPIGDRAAKKLIVHMEILEQEGEMANGVSYVYWTFGGSVPGSFIRTRVGDEV